MGSEWFLSAGFVGDRPSVWSIGNTQLAGGGGVRFRIDEERKLNIRLDVGVGDGGAQYYFTIGEAF